MSTDVKQYLESEIANNRDLSWFDGTAAFFLMCVCVLGLFVFILLSNPKPRDLQKLKAETDIALADEDAIPKLNYLIHYLAEFDDNSVPKLMSKQIREQSLRTYAWLPLVVVILGFAAGPTISFFHPVNVFLLGAEKQAYDTHIRRASNIFWTCVVGLIVGVVASLIVWKTTT